MDWDTFGSKSNEAEWGLDGSRTLTLGVTNLAGCPCCECAMYQYQLVITTTHQLIKSLQFNALAFVIKQKVLVYNAECTLGREEHLHKKACFQTDGGCFQISKLGLLVLE